ncbi:MAG: nucleotidyltransferase domain-containing protein [Leptolyngbya sp.]|nr:nucleotidyltransferase domain-containing protein [Candidatus Melainabacteria bacterium]
MHYPDALYTAVKEHKYPLLFATVSGAHLYGFPSPDSDYDLRGVHVLPLEQLVGMDIPEETIESIRDTEEIELDLVTHDVKKFFLMMLNKNGYVLEQLYSPLIVHTTPEHDELKNIGINCITRHHCHHYLGFADTQWKLFEKETPPRVKPLLYVFRVLLTGIHLMRTGEVEANIVNLNSTRKSQYIDELIKKKLETTENQTLTDTDLEFYRKEYLRLRSEVEEASRLSSLPEAPKARPALNDLLKRIRLGQNK